MSPSEQPASSLPNGKRKLDLDIALLGCGKMGLALMDGWLAAGLPGRRIVAIEPKPSDALRARAEQEGVRILAPDAAEALAVDMLVLAVKPQVMADALPAVAPLAGPATPALSIAAGLPIAYFKQALSEDTPVIRAMPNTPAAVGRGVSALIASDDVTAAARGVGEALLSVVGETLWLQDEAQMDAVTGVSGSGPAYVFHMIEALAAAAVAEGLPEEIAMQLARATVVGAGALAGASPESAEQLRINVTSPGGTTAAGLAQLMDAENGLAPLMRRTVAAAAARSRELGK